MGLKMEIVSVKRCKKCASFKSLEDFYKTGVNKDGYFWECKECTLSHRKIFYQENKEKIIARLNTKEYKEKKRAYRKTNSEKIRISKKAYRKTNSEKIRISKKAYYQTEAGKISDAKCGKARRARKMGATVEDFTSQEIFIRDRYICQACGIKTRPDYKSRYHSKYPNLDHIIPLSVGGEHSKRNVQCLCHKCNLEKGNRHANDQMLLIG